MLEKEFNGMMEAVGLGHLDKTGTQWVQMRRAFFGGAAVTMQIVESVGELEDEDEGVQVLEALSVEVDNFVISMEQCEK